MFHFNVYSLFKVLLLLLFLVTCHCKNRLAIHEIIDGSVEAGNYTYYVLPVRSSKYTLRVTITLNVLDGDADLYISGKGNKPTFETENHDYQAASCGDVELVELPYSYSLENSPIVIGVYGHPRYQVSQYKLKVQGFLDPPDDFMKELTDYERLNDPAEYLQKQQQNQQQQQQQQKREVDYEEDDDDDDRRSNFSWGITLWNFLEAVLQIVFEVLT